MRSIVWRNAKLVLPIGLTQAIVYFTLNHFPLFESRPLPTMWLDDAMPFWPWTIWPYLVLILAPVVLPFFVRDEAVFRQAMWAYVPAIALTLTCHLVWPTRIDRPVPLEDGTLTAWAFAVLLWIDSPNGCFPSGHIVGPAILCWAFWRDGQRFGLLVLAMFPLFSLTILTTKQHYLWDLLAGYVVALLGIALSYWITRTR